MKKASTMYVVDLTKIDGDGDFPCPYCGALISPEDEKDDTYIIQEIKMKGNEELEKLVIKCKGCGSIIHITGFDL